MRVAVHAVHSLDQVGESPPLLAVRPDTRPKPRIDVVETCLQMRRPRSSTLQSCTPLQPAHDDPVARTTAHQKRSSSTFFKALLHRRVCTVRRRCQRFTRPFFHGLGSSSRSLTTACCQFCRPGPTEAGPCAGAGCTIRQLTVCAAHPSGSSRLAKTRSASEVCPVD